MDARDELLSPMGCGRCGGVFLPRPDRLVICPRCNACHHGAPLPADVSGAELLNAWLRSHTGDGPVERAPVGFSLHRLNGRMHIPRDVALLQTGEGHSVLMERGRLDGPSSPAVYMNLRLAGFCAAPGSAPLPTSPLDQIAPVRRTPFGLELEATGTAVGLLRGFGQERVMAELGRLAQALGLEPILALSEASLDALPPEVTEELGRGERTVRCEGCGAPVALHMIAGMSSASCPWCTAGVRVPPALEHELEGYRRRLRVQDAMTPPDFGQVWEQWGAGKAALEGCLACPVCGAPSRHRPGVVDERCAHCGAMIIPSEEQLHEDLEHARDHDRRGKAVREAARRKSMAGQQQLSNVALLINGALFGTTALCIIGGIAFPLLGIVLSGEAELQWLHLALVGVAVLFMGVVPLGLALHLARKAKAQRELRTALWSRIAEQLSGETLSRSGASAWLTRWWPSSIADGQLTIGGPGAGGTGVAGRVGGFELLVHGNLHAGLSAGLYGRTWMRVSIAASWPPSAGFLKTTEGVRRRRAALAAAGFRTCLRRGGIEILVDHGVVARFKNSPDATAIVVPVIYEALRVARLLAARPARPLG